MLHWLQAVLEDPEDQEHLVVRQLLETLLVLRVLVHRTHLEDQPVREFRGFLVFPGTLLVLADQKVLGDLRHQDFQGCPRPLKLLLVPEVLAVQVLLAVLVVLERHWVLLVLEDPEDQGCHHCLPGRGYPGPHSHLQGLGHR